MGFFTRTKVPVTERQALQAAAVFGFLSLEGLSVDLVRNAFREAVKECHPDAGGSAELAAHKLDMMASARQTLLKWIEDLPADDCPFCKGTHFVRSNAFGAVKPCTHCQR